MTRGAMTGKRAPQIEARIHALVVGTTRLGPGYRAGVWFQGCPFRCRGCIAPDTLRFDGGVTMEVGEIIGAIEADCRIDGVTCSGGEPFAQPEALASLLAGVRDRCGIIVFSGYRLEHLRSRGTRHRAVAAALRLIDVLIDGVYVEERNNSHTQMSGSDNQRIHFLTDRYADDRYFETYDRASFEVLPTVSGEAMLIGIPTRQSSDVWEILGTTTGLPGGNE